MELTIATNNEIKDVFRDVRCTETSPVRVMSALDWENALQISNVIDNTTYWRDAAFFPLRYFKQLIIRVDASLDHSQHVLPSVRELWVFWVII